MKRRAALLFAWVLCTGLNACAKAPGVQEFSLETDFAPGALTLGPDGDLWFTDSRRDRIVQMTPGGARKEFALAPGSQPVGIASGPDGALWFTEKKKIGRITPAGETKEFELPSRCFPDESIVAGSDGNLWFSAMGGGRGACGPSVGRITPAGVISLFSLPAPPTVRSTNLYDAVELVSGQDGAIWFTRVAGDVIGRIDTKGQVTLFPIPTHDAGAFSLAAGRDGAVWFVEAKARKLGRISRDGNLSEFALKDFEPGDYNDLRHIASAADGALWIATSDSDGAGKLLRVQVAATAPRMEEFWLQSSRLGGHEPDAIVAGPDGQLWVSVSVSGGKAAMARLRPAELAKVQPGR
jgi:virginiamycin B lyase